MTTASIDGKKYIQMLVGGASVLAEHTQELNSLNVFPVADGDTGTNMFRTRPTRNSNFFNSLLFRISPSE